MVETPPRRSPINNHVGGIPQRDRYWGRTEGMFKEALPTSPARWNLVLNDVPMLPFGFDMTCTEGGDIDEVWWSDCWDGYPLERDELMAFIALGNGPRLENITIDGTPPLLGIKNVREDWFSCTQWPDN
jgi:hypothetical protein